MKIGREKLKELEDSWDAMLERMCTSFKEGINAETCMPVYGEWAFDNWDDEGDGWRVKVVFSYEFKLKSNRFGYSEKLNISLSEFELEYYCEKEDTCYPLSDVQAKKYKESVINQVQPYIEDVINDAGHEDFDYEEFNAYLIRLDSRT